jgi:hypothetical protein
MIKFIHDGLHMSHQKARWKGYVGADASKWNFEVEPFVVR